MSVAEIFYFTKLFGVLVGDKIDEADEEVMNTWKIYIEFCQILDLLTSPRFVEAHLIRLDYLIQNFLEDYYEKFGHFTIKMHNMVHMVRIIRQNGPATFFSTMRFEAKHRVLRQWAVLSSNRINAPKTLALRTLLKLAHFKFTGQLNFSQSKIKNSCPIDSYTRSIHFPKSTESEKIVCTDVIEVEEKDYHVGMVLVIELGVDNLISFGEITKIFLKNNDDVSFLFDKIECLDFDEHRNAYNVKKTSLKKYEELPEINPCYFIKIDETTQEAFIIAPYGL